jgi:hypothetical protein
MSFQRRFKNNLSFGFNDTMSLSDKQQAGVRLNHNADGSYRIRSDQAEADALIGNNHPVPHAMRANFVWQLPRLRGGNPAVKAVGRVVNDWQLSGIWSGARTSSYAVGFGYQSGGSSTNLTGSPDYGARIRIVRDTGRGCSREPLRQFNTEAFQGPSPGSLGLDSGTGYLKGCFINVLDLAIARNIRFDRSRTLQLRVDMFNAPNWSTITARNTTVNLTNPTDPVTATNLPFDANGNVIDARARPRGAGFGVATGYQAARTLQAQVRFSF